MTATTPANSTLLKELWDFYDYTIGGLDSMCAFVATLIALTGRTPTPVSARTVGNSLRHEEIALAIESVLGESCRFVTSLTFDGILALGDPTAGALNCLMSPGQTADDRVRESLAALIRRIPLRSLDGSPTKAQQRLRQFDSPISVLVIRGDEWSDPAVVNELLTIRVNNNGSAAISTLSSVLGRFTTGGRLAVDHRPWAAGLRQRLHQIEWKTRVEFPDGEIARSAVTDMYDVKRVEQALSLAAVRRLLLEEPAANSSPVAGDRDDIERIVQLLETVGADDDRVRLSYRARELLRFLQGKAWDTGTAGVGKPGEGKFTCYEIQIKIGGTSPPCIDTIRNRLDALTNAGMAEEADPIGRKGAWQLTKRGKSFEKTPLAGRLCGFLTDPESDKSEELRNTTIPSSVNHAPPTGAVAP